MSTISIIGIICGGLAGYLLIASRINIYLQVWRGWKDDDAWGFGATWPVTVPVRCVLWACILKPIGWVIARVFDGFDNLHDRMLERAVAQKQAHAEQAKRKAQGAQDLPKASVVKE